MRTSFRTIISAAMLLSAMALSAQQRDFTFNNSAQREGLSIEHNTRSGLEMRHALKQMSLVSISDNGYTGEAIHAGTGIALPADAGQPNLPSFSQFVAVPNGAAAHIEMGYRSMTTVRNVDLMAAAPLKFDTDDSPNTYEKDMAIYGRDAFYPEQPVTVSAPFSLRGVQTVAVTVVPFQYNPVTKELRVYDDLQFGVRFDGGNGHFGDDRLRSPYWDPILMQNLANYDQLPVIDYEARMQQWVTNRPTGCEDLIVIPNNESFRQYANQLAEYRIKQGILTEVKSLSDMGCTTTNMMKSYFHNAYNTWDIPPVAVLLLGDHNANMGQGIPAETTYHSQNYGNCITDNGYADVDGNNLPEMAFSRLVAANANEAQMMVSKQLEYEFTNPNMDAASYDHPITALGWQTERWFQICSEVVGGYWRNQGKHPVRINAIYSGNPGSVWSSNQNTSMVVSYFGPNGTGYIPATPSELGGWTGGTGAQVVQAVNSGCMLLQHRDHGYYQGWGEPDFSTSNVAQMNNTGKLTFVNTINCQTGTFDHSPECLIEAFMRRTSGGQNAGAVGCIGPTQTSYSFVNDAYAWGMYDQYDPQFLPTFGPFADYEGNWRPAFGNVAGKYFLEQSSWPYNTQNKAITYKMFTAHCDAFLTLYTQVPQTMTVNHPAQVTTSTTSINVTAPAGAVIALTRNNQILAVATATGATQSITFPSQPANTTITIVGTKQDYRRYVGSITVISEPNLTLTDVTVNDGNNAQLEYGEQASFDMTIKNIGDLASTLATATLSTSTPELVTITNATEQIPAVAPNQTTDLTEVFGITVADNVPDQSRLQFTLDMTAGTHHWTNDFNFTAYAPVLKIGTRFDINDGGAEKGNGNGRLDPGETALITMEYANVGHADISNVVATLSTLMTQYITIEQTTITTSDVGIGETIELTYTVSVSNQMPRGDNASLTLSVASGAYSDAVQIVHRVGLEIANFENGLEGFEWQNDAEHPWTITTTNPYSGSHCLQSGDISHGQTSTLSLTYEVENPLDEIRFYRKTDSELDGDFLRFYIDDELKMEWSGPMAWREMTFPVGQGEHTFTWTYEKNSTISTGADHVWIDEILFPVKHINFACNAGPDIDQCMEAVQMNAFVIGYETLAWTTEGDGSFNETDIIDPIYTPGEQDLANKVVTLTLTAVSEQGETLTDEVVVRFHEPASIEMDDKADVCEGNSIEIEATTSEAGLATWSTDGDGSFSDLVANHTTYAPGLQDIENGTVTLTFKAISLYGCGDATRELVLTIHPIERTEFDREACVSYNWNGIEYTEAGDYEQTLQSVNGCDSIVTMHLTLVDIYHLETEATACDSYDWAGTTFTESGEYEHTFTSMHGCDSIVTLHLIINESYNPSAEITLAIDACDSYEWDGITYTESGIYERTYTNLHGCDSIVVVDLAVMTAPVIETINGDAEVDVRLTPTSVYTTVPNSDTFWSLEPEEAGTIVVEEGVATITWSETYKGEVALKAWVLGYCGQDESSMTVTVRNSTDISEYGIEANIYPNPTSGIVSITGKDLRQAEVINTLGQRVATATGEGETLQIDLSGLPAGVYFINVTDGEGRKCVRKVVKE